MIIYKATNTSNGKAYIGSTIHTLAIRKSQHLSEARRYEHTNKAFHKAIRRYGPDNFVWEILDESATSEQELRNLEQIYIKKHETFGEKGYNLTIGLSNTTTGYKFSDEYRKHLKIKMSGVNNPNWGRRWSQEQKAAAAKRARDRKSYLDPLTNENIAKNERVKKKIAATKLGIKNPNGCMWKLIDPQNNEYIIEGGIKREIKKYGLNYQQFKPYGKVQTDGSIKNKKGWKLCKLSM